MNNEQMTCLLMDLHKEELVLREAKGDEYTGGDPFQNFEWGGDMLAMNRQHCAWAYMVKHLTSIRMHVEGVVELTPAQLAEKVGDARLYLALIYAMELDDIPEDE